MTFWTPASIAAVVGGRWLREPSPERARSVHGVSIDSRHVAPGQVFIAIPGEKFDGHDFVDDVARAGASIALVSRAEPFGPRDDGLGVLLVPSTQDALVRLAAAYRRTLTGTRVIAVAGSNGKTTTKRLVSAVLASRYRGTSAPKSFNNSIGVPLTLLGARSGDQYVVCEIGTNAPGESARLAIIVEPDVAVITAVGREHMAGLGGAEGSAQEAASVTNQVRSGGVCVINESAALLMPSTKIAPGLCMFGTSEHADLRVSEVVSDARGVSFTINRRWKYHLALLGAHNAMNAAAAIAVGLRFGMQHEQIAAALAGVKPEPMRLEPVPAGAVTLINDAYNANPDSMRCAMEALRDVGSGAARRVLIMGDMLELGEHARACHREAAETLIRMGDIDVAICIGPESRHAFERLREVWPARRCEWHAEISGASLPAILASIQPGDCVLVKGSRGMRLERVCDAVASHFRVRSSSQAEAAAAS